MPDAVRGLPTGHRNSSPYEPRHLATRLVAGILWIVPAFLLQDPSTFRRSPRDLARRENIE
ncbi:hypothetical protein [Breoghania sp.]|uniref:hypothetical protein n=1 Tax=Breoghania sp. TaxID=2065378 RepID=UPI00263451D9|nr:hypothetical protein [Breoghania sp.]MDJ0932851.1 hypothetical protein [Breoghania sp.]